MAPVSLRLLASLLVVLLSVANETAAQLSPPTQDYVLRFATEHVAVASDAPALDLGEAFTMAGWFLFERADSEAYLMGRLNDPWSSPPHVAYVIQINWEGRLELAVSNGTTEGQAWATGPTPPVGRWVHVAGTLSGGVARLFVDGAEVASSPFAGNPSTQAGPFAVGGGADNGMPAHRRGLWGYVRQVSVWSVALDAAAVRAIAEGGVAGTEAGLVAAWALDERMGDVAPDSGPNGLDLRFDRVGWEPAWRETDPIWYATDAVAAPYFRVADSAWLETIGVPENWAVQDVYPIDFSGDGLKDVVVSLTSHPATYPETPTRLRALQNTGDGSFLDVTDAVLGEVWVVAPRFGHVADFNGDGLDDLYIADSGTDTPPIPGGQNTLLLGSPDGRLTDRSATHLPQVDNANHGLAVGDVDGDGDLDLVLTSQGSETVPVTPELHLNDGSGRFTVADNAAFTDIFQAVSALLVDWDRDGDLDLLLGVDAGFVDGAFTLVHGIVMMENDGTGRFSYPRAGGILENVILSGLGEDGADSNSFLDMQSADVDGDGWVDLVVSVVHGYYQGGRLDLVLNDGAGGFSPVVGAFDSPHFGPHDTNFWVMYLRVADVNGDGWPDVWGEGTHAGDYLFANDGTGRFTDAGWSLSPRVNSFGSASALFDLEGDGDVDVFSVSYRNIQVLTNERRIQTAAIPLPPPAAPVLVAPGDGATFSAGEVTLSWAETTPHPYAHLQIASDGAFDDLVVDRERLTGTELTLADLPADSRLHWRVRGLNSAGYGDWSASRSFVTGQAVSIDGPPPTDRVRGGVFPNPARGEAWVSYELPTVTEVDIAVFDILGRRIATLARGLQAQGSHRVAWAGGAAGTYVVRIEAGAMVITKPIVVVR